jgi:hypothetical protein
MDDKKTIGLIASIATALLCGCPGICLCLFGAIFSIPGETYSSNLYETGDLPPEVGYFLLCIGLFMVLIPVGIGGYTFFSQRNAKPSDQDLDEPIPPAI